MAGTAQNIEKLDFEKVWLMFKETDRKFQETDRKFDKIIQESDKKNQVTSKQIKELGKQIGGLGNKFGSFNEALFLPSLDKMLKEKFNCNSTSQRYSFADNGNSFEIDILGISDDSCYVIEIKTNLNNDAVKQLQNTIEKFKKYDKISQKKKIFGILCAVDFAKESVKFVTDSGFYFITATDDLAELKVPRNFKAKAY